MPHSPLTARTAVGGGVDRHDAASPPAKVRWPACGVPRLRQTAKHYWNRTPARARYTPDRRFFRGAARTHEQNTEPRDYRRGVSTRRAPASTDGTVCTTDETQGFMKVLVGGSDDQILGFTTVGAEAGEVMAVVQTAMLASVPHVTPPRIGNRKGPASRNTQIVDAKRNSGYWPSRGPMVANGASRSATSPQLQRQPQHDFEASRCNQSLTPKGFFVNRLRPTAPERAQSLDIQLGGFCTSSVTRLGLLYTAPARKQFPEPQCSKFFVALDIYVSMVSVGLQAIALDWGRNSGEPGSVPALFKNTRSHMGPPIELLWRATCCPSVFGSGF